MKRNWMPLKAQHRLEDALGRLIMKKEASA